MQDINYLTSANIEYLRQYSCKTGAVLFIFHHLDRPYTSRAMSAELREKKVSFLHGRHKANTKCFVEWLADTAANASCPQEWLETSGKSYLSILDDYAQVARYFANHPDHGIMLPHSVKEALCSVIRDRSSLHERLKYELGGRLTSNDERHRKIIKKLEEIRDLLEPLVVVYPDALISAESLVAVQRRNMVPTTYHVGQDTCPYHGVVHYPYEDPDHTAARPGTGRREGAGR